MNDKPIWFPQWMKCLEKSGKSPGQISNMALVIRWYLSFCKRGRVRVTFQSARDFLQCAQSEKQPSPALLEEWKEAIRWFFRAARATEDEGCRVKDAGLESSASLPRRQQTCHEGVERQGKPGCGEEAEWRARMRTLMRVRHYSYRTEQSYLHWGARFAAYVGVERVAEAGEEQVKGFLEQLAAEEEISSSTQRQALNAVVFLLREAYGRALGDFSDYKRAKTRTRMPTVLTRQEVRAMFEQLEGTPLLMVKVMYGSGLRLMELLRLRVKDVDLERQLVVVRFGKGGKDRVAPLGQELLIPLGEHMKRVRGLYEEDRRNEVAGVSLPDNLEKKYPNAGKEWPWFWMWPARGLSVDPRVGIVRRHHVMERSFQCLVKEAARRAGIHKRVTPHILRHHAGNRIMPSGVG